MREEELSDRLGSLLACIHVPEAVALNIVASLQSDLQQSERQRQNQSKALGQKLSAVRTRMDRIYDDKLDGKISEELWTRKQSELREQELTVENRNLEAERSIDARERVDARKSF